MLDIGIVLRFIINRNAEIMCERREYSGQLRIYHILNKRKIAEYFKWG